MRGQQEEFYEETFVSDSGSECNTYPRLGPVDEVGQGDVTPRAAKQRGELWGSSTRMGMF